MPTRALRPFKPLDLTVFGPAYRTVGPCGPSFYARVTGDPRLASRPSQNHGIEAHGLLVDAGQVAVLTLGILFSGLLHEGDSRFHHVVQMWGSLFKEAAARIEFGLIVSSPGEPGHPRRTWGTLGV